MARRVCIVDLSIYLLRFWFRLLVRVERAGEKESYLLFLLMMSSSRIEVFICVQTAYSHQAFHEQVLCGFARGVECKVKLVHYGDISRTM